MGARADCGVARALSPPPVAHLVASSYFVQGKSPVIDYERTSWWRTVLRFHGTVLPYVLGRVGLLTGLSLALCLLDDLVLELCGMALPALDQLGHSVLGMALSMLIVFRTNSSNGRYWDGLACRGGLINGSRNLARMGAVFAPPAQPLSNLLTAYAVSVAAIRYAAIAISSRWRS